MKPHVDYEVHGRSYAQQRHADPRIAAAIHAALGDAKTVVNVGAGAGSYEPDDRWVLAVEPSATMRAQRAPGAAPAVAANAEHLPFDDDTFDAAMATVTVHHWDPRAAGLAELRRVARGPVVVFTFDLYALPAWQREYFGRLIDVDGPRFGQPEDIAAELGGRTRIQHVATPADCTDGFFEAYWNRPEAMLDPAVRAAQSVWALFGPGEEEAIIGRLADDLASGAWDEKYGDLRTANEIDGALRLVISEAD